MIPNPERLTELSAIRQKVLQGKAEKSDLARAVIILREGRKEAQAASAAKSGGKVKAPVNVDALFSELDTKA